MTIGTDTKNRAPSWPAVDVQLAGRAVLRVIGQIFFQENALTGALFVLGIALGSPWLALAVLAGSAIGWATAWLLKFDESERNAGIYGFNSALVGIATLVFFRPGS